MAKPEVSLGLGLATATVVISVYSHGMPKAVDIRSHEPQDADLETVRKQNAWLAAGVVAGISLLARDTTIFVMGGITLVALDWLTRVNNAHNPVTQLIEGNPFKLPGGSHDNAMPATADGPVYGLPQAVA